MDKLYSEIESLLNEIPADFGGGCSPEKAYLLAWLIRRYDLKTTIDIGVYRGRSFFPQGLAHAKFTGGVVYGVDPWEVSEAKEFDLPQELKARIDKFLEQTDFEKIYQRVLFLIQRLHFEEHCIIVRKTSADAVKLFDIQGILFDLIHIDGNHDTNIVMSDVESYLPRLKANGFVVLDDISWESVKPAYRLLVNHLKLIYRTTHLPENDYAIFLNSHSHIAPYMVHLSLRYAECLSSFNILAKSRI